ncbi:MAG: hypothetical protein Q9201_001043 [Fulgogasparrea decipioides]
MASSFQGSLFVPYSSPFRRPVCSSCLRASQRQWPCRRKSIVAQILDSDEPSSKDEDHTLKPLSRPVGVTNPPKPGENSGIDLRSWGQRRDDLFDYDRHLVRRKQLYAIAPLLYNFFKSLVLHYDDRGNGYIGDMNCSKKETLNSCRTKQVAKPYFRDWTRANYHRGKTFLAPSRIFRADKSLYFPNLVGSTLASPSTSSDTSSVLQNQVSVVSVYSGRWAELQTQTFADNESHPELAKLVSETERSNGPLQKVEINIEEDWMKAIIVRTFMSRIRKQRREQDWGRYFLVRRGVTDEMREAIGMRNAKVGYVYLVDWLCRIRWAGSADAGSAEKEALVAGASKLVEAWRRQAEEGNETSGQEPALKAAG